MAISRLLDGVPEREVGLIPFHFDVPTHDLYLEHFIENAKSTKAILDNFNKEMFDGKLNYKLLVVPPKAGTFLEVLGILTVPTVVIWAFLNSEIGKAYIKGLTGHEPVYWAEKAGKFTQNYIKDESGSVSAKLMQAAVNLIMAQTVLGFLQKKTEQLHEVGISQAKYKDAYLARNRIYKACLDNADVKAIGFDVSSHFSIKRTDFDKYIVPISSEEEEPEIINWTVEVKDIKVNSPNWKREGRKWQAESNTEREVWFSIEDNMFWHHVQIKDIKPDINDNMTVQWAFPANSPNRNIKALRVLTYNGKTISKRLSKEELETILKDFSIEEEEHPRLF